MATAATILAWPAEPLLVRRSLTAAGIYLSVGFGFLATVLTKRQLDTSLRLLSTVIYARASSRRSSTSPPRRRSSSTASTTHAGGLGPAARPLPQRALVQDGRRPARDGRAGRARAVRRPDLQRPRPRGSVPDRLAASVPAEPGGRLERGADPARPLRRARLAARGVDGAAARRARDRRALRRHAGGHRPRRLAGRGDDRPSAPPASIAFRRFPHADHTALGEHRRGILGFVVQSSLRPASSRCAERCRRSCSASSPTRPSSATSASRSRRRTASRPSPRRCG